MVRPWIHWSGEKRKEVFESLLNDFGFWSSEERKSSGRICGLLKEMVSEVTGLKYVVPVASGAAGIEAMLWVAKHASLLTGEEPVLVTQGYSFYADYVIAAMLGFRVYVVDVLSEYPYADVDKVREVVDSVKGSGRTVVILPVLYYGAVSEEYVKAVNEYAFSRDALVIWDAAHCFGVRLVGSGRFGSADPAVLSFYANKMLDGCEGGALVTNSSVTASVVERTVNYGRCGSEEPFLPGSNWRMSELHAAYILSGYEEVRRRVEVGRRNLKHAVDVLGDAVVLPEEVRRDVSKHNGYVMLAWVGEGRRREAEKKLIGAGVGVWEGYVRLAADEVVRRVGLDAEVVGELRNSVRFSRGCIAVSPCMYGPDEWDDVLRDLEKVVKPYRAK